MDTTDTELHWAIVKLKWILGICGAEHFAHGTGRGKGKIRGMGQIDWFPDKGFTYLGLVIGDGQQLEAQNMTLWKKKHPHPMTWEEADIYQERMGPKMKFL